MRRTHQRSSLLAVSRLAVLVAAAACSQQTAPSTPPPTVSLFVVNNLANSVTIYTAGRLRQCGPQRPHRGRQYRAQSAIRRRQECRGRPARRQPDHERRSRSILRGRHGERRSRWRRSRERAPDSTSRRGSRSTRRTSSTSPTGRRTPSRSTRRWRQGTRRRCARSPAPPPGSTSRIGVAVDATRQPVRHQLRRQYHHGVSAGGERQCRPVGDDLRREHRPRAVRSGSGCTPPAASSSRTTSATPSRSSPRTRRGTWRRCSRSPARTPALNQPVGIALDASGQLYVANFASDRIAVFPVAANGNATPSFSIVGNATGLNGPAGLTF